MLTSIGRAAAARRALASAPSKLARARTAAAAARWPVAAAPPAAAVVRAVRGFAVSAAARAPAARAAKEGTKPKAAAKGTKKKTAPAKAAKPKKKKKTAKAAAAKKKAPKKKAAKKPLTAEEREKDTIKKLKVMALLKRPKLLPESSWTAYSIEKLPSTEGASLPDRIRAIRNSYLKLPDAEFERLRSKAESNHAANKKMLDEWVQSFPEVIWMANVARRRLSRLLDRKGFATISDHRLPKRPRNAYSYFMESRFKEISGSNPDAPATFRQIASEWNAMGETEKQRYRDQAAAEGHDNEGQLKELRTKAKEYWATHKGGSASLI